MKIHKRIFPVTKPFINELREAVRKNFSPSYEKNLTDREVLKLTETVLLNSYLDKVFKDGDDLAEDKVIEY